MNDLFIFQDTMFCLVVTVVLLIFTTICVCDKVASSSRTLRLTHANMKIQLDMLINDRITRRALWECPKPNDLVAIEKRSFDLL